MAFSTANPVPFQWVHNQDSMAPAITNGSIGETSAQTFKEGTPLTLTSGLYLAWGGAAPTAAPVLLGVSTQFGQNLTTSNTAQGASFGSVPNQSSAVNLYMTGPVPLGGQPFYKAGFGNVFRGLLGSTGANVTPAITDIGTRYGLTKDSTTGYWYVDKAKTAANDVAVTVINIDPVTSQGGITTGTLVWFTVLDAVVIPS